MRSARHYHGTSSNLPATKRKQLKSSFFCLPTMLHWTCQCKQNVKFTKSRGIIWHIKLPAYTVDCQWWLSERHLGMIPRGLCSFWYLGLYMAFYLERALKCCKEPLWTFQGVFHFNIIDGPYCQCKQNVKFTKSRGSYDISSYLDIGKVSKYEVIFFQYKLKVKIYKRLARMDMQQILEIFYGKTWLSSFVA